MKSVNFYNISLVLLLFYIGGSLHKTSPGKPPQTSGRHLKPYIDLPGSPDVNVSLGRTATLRCKTVNLIKKSVSWLRRKDVKLLSVGTYLYTTDSRLAVRQDLSGGEWQLVIRDVAFSDAGEYECQINTSPVLSHTITLAVVEPYTKILLDNSADDGSLYIDIRSVLNLTCAVFSPEIPAAIFWKHNGKLLDLEGAQEGNIQTVEGRAGSPTLSLLSLVLSRTEQSGTYTCSPSNTGQDQVTVHIVQDKELPVGQSQSGSPGQERTAEQENVRARTTSPSHGHHLTGSALLVLGLLLPSLALSHTGPVN